MAGVEARVDDDILLAALQLADSAFPSGAYTLSHGLETLLEDGIVRDVDDIGRCLRATLMGRAAPGDLAALMAAHRAADPEVDLPSILAIDQRLAATKLAAEDRDGSRRVGGRLVVEAARLASSPALDGLRDAIATGSTPGTAAVAFGVAANALGIPPRAAAIAAGNALATALLSAAVRLGRMGHGDLQRLLRAAAPTIRRAVDVAEATDWHALRPSTPGFDIAIARHETATGRLFAS
jgi:urease accessory protein